MFITGMQHDEQDFDAIERREIAALSTFTTLHAFGSGPYAMPKTGVSGAPMYDGPMHGPELPNWSDLADSGLMPRLCSCGAVETGFFHSWHSRECNRFEWA